MKLGKSITSTGSNERTPPEDVESKIDENYKNKNKDVRILFFMSPEASFASRGRRFLLIFRFLRFRLQLVVLHVSSSYERGALNDELMYEQRCELVSVVVHR